MTKLKRWLSLYCRHKNLELECAKNVCLALKRCTLCGEVLLLSPIENEIFTSLSATIEKLKQDNFELTKQADKLYYTIHGKERPINYRYYHEI